MPRTGSRSRWAAPRPVPQLRRGAFVPSALGIVALAVLITVVVWRSGSSGSPTGLVHLFYLPVIFVGAAFGRAAAAGAGVTAGLAAGPFMPVAGTLGPLDGAAQPVGEWVVRLSLFVVVGVVVAWLVRQEPRPLDVLLRDLVLARRLCRAVDAGRVTAHYQPIVDLGDGRVVGMEALARWTEPSGRPVPPGDFIPAAERTGTIGVLGLHLLRLAIHQAERWDPHAEVPAIMSVNVSAAQLSDPAFLADLTAVLSGSTLVPAQLCLEITETAIIADPKAALATVQAAHDLGVSIALDDFGTGQSSLAYLAEFPIDIVKIDKSFVDEVDRDPKVNALVLAIVEMAKALRAVTIAEGIERPSQLVALRHLGCRLGQGYHLGRPGPSASLEQPSPVQVPVPVPVRTLSVVPEQAGRRRGRWVGPLGAEPARSPTSVAAGG